ncbi:MAG: diaminopimelate decarboxylase [Candidatus Bathyarchaeota archaeon]|nr:diaminopimelate decarboxylase [Candidatus Bathyarchaeota archaeon]
MIKPPLANVNGILHIDGVSAVKLAETYGTPLYVIGESKIRENYRRLAEAFKRNYGKTRILYSAKANTNLSILKILKTEGAWVDVVSTGEIYLALEAGFQPSQILYTGVSVSEEELSYAFKAGVTINIDSESQLRKLLRIGVPHTLSVRINTEIGAGHHEYTVTASKISKFGVDEKTALEIYRTARLAGVEKFGIHMHIGSGILNPDPYIKAAERLLQVAKNIHEVAGVNFEFVDVGGGIGVPYRPDEEEFDIEGFADKLTVLFKEEIQSCGLGEPELWLEPGRYLVAESTILLTRVNMVKQTPYRKFVGVDAGFNVLIRPTMYGSYHHVVVANRLNAEPAEKCDIVGPICESGDFLCRERLLPEVAEGDLIAVLTAGAYGYSMSSQYNSRPRPAEVLVKNGLHEVIRERETLQDLLRGQKTASWLNV